MGLLLCITYVVSSSAFWDNVFKHRPLWKVGLSPVPGIGHLQDTPTISVGCTLCFPRRSPRRSSPERGGRTFLFQSFRCLVTSLASWFPWRCCSSPGIHADGTRMFPPRATWLATQVPPPDPHGDPGAHAARVSGRQASGPPVRCFRLCLKRSKTNK